MNLIQLAILETLEHSAKGALWYEIPKRSKGRVSRPVVKVHLYFLEFDGLVSQSKQRSIITERGRERLAQERVAV